MEKQEWKKPELIIIKRDRPEENVLLLCADYGQCESETPTSTS
jgi:hypothetical protein